MKILLLTPVTRSPLLLEKWLKELENKSIDALPLPFEQAQSSWIRALRRLNHQVFVFRYTEPVLMLGKFLKNLPIIYGYMERLHRGKPNLCPDIKMRNSLMVEYAKREKVDLVLISGGTNIIFPDTVKRIKQETKAVVVLLNGTSPVMFADKGEKSLAPLVDYVFCNDPYHTFQWKELGVKKACALPVSAFDPDLAKSTETDTSRNGSNIKYNISFIGGVYPPSVYQERLEILNKVADLGLNLWTHQQKYLTKELLPYFKGEVWGSDMFSIYANSLININHHGNTMQGGGNLRTFEICGAGGFQLVDKVQSEWFVDGKELVAYDSPEDLLEKVKYYSQNEDERAQIAKAGKVNAMRNHTFDIRFTIMLDLLFSNL